MALSRSRNRVNRMRDMAPVSVSRAYDEIMAPAQTQFDRAVARIVRRAPEARRILDVGTGPGYLPPRLAAAYPRAMVTGLDTGPEMLAMARERARVAGVGDRVSIVEGSAYEMPFEGATFDLVVATNAIHVFDDLSGFAREAQRVLEPGGTLLVLDHRRDVALPIYALMWASTLIARTLRKDIDGMGPVIDACYTRSELEDAFSQAGFVQHGVQTGAVLLEGWGRA